MSEHITPNTIEAINRLIECLRTIYEAMGKIPPNIRFFAYDSTVSLEMLIAKLKEQYTQ